MLLGVWGMVLHRQDATLGEDNPDPTRMRVFVCLTSIGGRWFIIVSRTKSVNVDLDLNLIHRRSEGSVTNGETCFLKSFLYGRWNLFTVLISSLHELLHYCLGHCDGTRSRTFVLMYSEMVNERLFIEFIPSKSKFFLYPIQKID